MAYPDGNGFWNPGGDVQYEQQPPPQGSPYDLDAFYMRKLKRAPDANERATDMANIEKYGAAGFESDFEKRLGSAGQPNYQTPAQQWNSQPALGGQSNDFYKLLMDRAQQGLAVNRDDPTIRAQVDPMVAQSERASRNYLDELAERAGPLANLRGEQRLASERTGQAAGAFESEVIGREVAARRDEIAQALQLYGSQLSNDQRIALERELGYLNDAARTKDRDSAMEQFLRQLALQEWNLGNQFDLSWANLGG